MNLILTPCDSCTIASIQREYLIDANDIHEIDLELKTAAASCNYKLIVDCSGLQRVSSAFLGKLCALRKLCIERKGRLALCSCSSEMVDALKVTGLRILFDVFDHWPGAVAFMKQDTVVSWREDVK